MGNHKPKHLATTTMLTMTMTTSRQLTRMERISGEDGRRSSASPIRCIDASAKRRWSEDSNAADEAPPPKRISQACSEQQQLIFCIKRDCATLLGLSLQTTTRGGVLVKTVVEGVSPSST